MSPTAAETAAVYALARSRVYSRSGGRCEVCKRRLSLDAMHVHHRRARSQGRDDTLANLLGTCLWCHEDVHAHPTNSYEHGWIIPNMPPRAPAEVPVLLYGKWWLLGVDGSKVPTIPDNQGTVEE